ncbi:MAG: hypothetical protein LC731_00690 [Acidobacteria bacterium]|nr:hypothetical protein [Acidobacteriota bacterium]
MLGEFADGVFFIALEPIGDPNLVVSVIAQTLGVKAFLLSVPRLPSPIFL